MSIATRLAPVYFFPAIVPGMAVGAALKVGESKSDAASHQVLAGGGALAAGGLTYSGLHYAPTLVKKFHVDSAERISAHMIERNWSGRGAVAGAILAGIGFGILQQTNTDDLLPTTPAPTSGGANNYP